MLNKMQVKAIEEKLSIIIQRIERIEYLAEVRGELEKYKAELAELHGVLEGADVVLAALGYGRRYHMGEEDEKGRIRGSHYALEKI